MAILSNEVFNMTYLVAIVFLFINTTVFFYGGGFGMKIQDLLLKV